MASTVNFKLQQLDHSTSHLIRRGALHFTKKDKLIQTPACLTYTLRGAVPHVVSDNLKQLPVELLQISLEQFVEQREVSSFKYPHGLHKYLNLEENELMLYIKNYLLFCDMRDPHKHVPVSINSDKYLSVHTHGGVRQITPDLWGQAIEAYKPDLCATPADLVIEDEVKLKRVRRSVDRTLRWLDACLPKAQAAGVPVFAPVVGHHSEEDRAASATATAERDVQGFIINAFELDKESLVQQLKMSIEKLPNDKPRLVYGLATPEKILEGVMNGVDLFDGSYAYKVTERGRAITFKFGDGMPKDEPENLTKTVNLWDKSLANSFEPIDSSCGCYACSNPHTKAYIHHLLNAHEMLGPLLLMSHNIYQLDLFMGAIRKSIEKNSFQQDTEAFMKHYSHEQEGDGMKSHEEEVDVESLGAPLKKKRTLLL
ncbi:Queuine tRNA-ribosyltransferase subunit qtrtd1 [Apophysomyces sp. BC1034]|nr:Queuine tRNA-ribosyltransferase subunit qtrtd1 [Apophysomyces sp. BC1015]KAG0178144.1 Queuine tRNA-ribosyltransferase subunit qtrtd1 [Apophysomyces sp. BC1021]KAG0187489.1 Queuine tRNA-ribosyltransferase subunit qtrtd1 [Apophysomyces sp. BC1034]